VDAVVELTEPVFFDGVGEQFSHLPRITTENSTSPSPENERVDLGVFNCRHYKYGLNSLYNNSLSKTSPILQFGAAAVIREHIT